MKGTELLMNINYTVILEWDAETRLRSGVRRSGTGSVNWARWDLNPGPADYESAALTD